LHRFADLGAVEAVLSELARSEGQPLVVQLPRAPGARENRWAHLLSGPVAEEAEHPSAAATRPASVAPDTAAAEIASLKADVARLAAETDELRALVERLARNLAAPQ
jgi:hypothetical protein